MLGKYYQIRRLAIPKSHRTSRFQCFRSSHHHKWLLFPDRDGSKIGELKVAAERVAEEARELAGDVPF